jgi:hypothetical protein
MKSSATKRRSHWVAELARLSGSFGDDSTKAQEQLRLEVKKEGCEALLEHLRICGAIPENFEHDSSAEKLYSKYTDAVISEAFSIMGLASAVIEMRADAADVQARADAFSLVADAKAFRLSRTAKNQKDFKIQALDGWRGGLDFAVVVCPIYQLPNRTSQIYQQAIARNVCILSYSHLSALVGLAMRQGKKAAMTGLQHVLETVAVLHPSKSAVDYWTGINRSLIASLAKNADLWTIEKSKSLASLDIVKNEALGYLRAERNRLLGLSRQQAVEELLRSAGLDSRIAKVEGIEHGTLLGVSVDE